MTGEAVDPVSGNGVAKGEVGWKFPRLNFGTYCGFNDAALDTFKSDREQGLVREMIQNSLDARLDEDAPVVVRFDLYELEDLSNTGFQELRKYFEAALAVESNPDAKSFYQRAISRMECGVIQLLCVHDYNTGGLHGPTENPSEAPARGRWLALVRGAGVTFKESSSALGSFGHGSRAPFAMSDLRTVFYFTRIKTDGGTLETRFQGKSILQSVPLNGITGEDDWSVSTGYFGVREKCLPLTDDDVPEWATAARPEDDPATPSIGTSIFIPEPFGFSFLDPRRLWQKVKLAVVANFYYAVLKEKLVVHIGDEVIDKDSISQALDDVEADLDKLRPTDKIKERLESARTIRHAEDSGIEVVKGFGDVAWYIRLEGVSNRTVGVARGTGMLITQRAEKLRRFPGTKPFDLFVCVIGDGGSEILRMLENPEHTEFAFGRINDPDERTRAEKAYGNFTESIRQLITRHASIDQVDEEEVDDLDDFFRGDLGAGSEDATGEPNRAIRIVAKKVKAHRGSKPTEVPGAADYGATGGAPRGEGPRGGGQAGGAGPGIGTGRGRGSLTSGLPVKELRLARRDAITGLVDVAFTPIDGARKTFVLLRSGESETERIRFRTEEEMNSNAEWRDSLKIDDLSPTARKRLRLEFNPDDLEFAIEGKLLP